MNYNSEQWRVFGDVLENEAIGGDGLAIVDLWDCLGKQCHHCPCVLFHCQFLLSDL